MSVQVLIISCLVLLAVGASDAIVSYKGYSLFSAKPEDQLQLNELKTLATKGSQNNDVDFWLPPTTIGRDVSFLVKPAAKVAIVSYLQRHNISTLETVEDVGLEIEASNADNTTTDLDNMSLWQTMNSQQERGFTAPNTLDPFFANYQPFSVIEQRILDYQNKPNYQVRTIGMSNEQRRLYLVQVSSDFRANKPVILIDAGHHAREWISHSTIMFLMESIGENLQAKNRSYLASKLRQYDFWFVPAVNPDGYEYSHQQNRLWRKTRSRGAYCHGTDPNRNYDEHWNVGNRGGSNECSETYAGQYAQSEVEVRQMSQLLYQYRQQIAMYISLHSFSQLILWPYGHAASAAPSNEIQVRQVAQAGALGIKAYRGTSYGLGRTAQILYVATGNSVDYAMAKCGIKFAYTLELPDRGQRGFVLDKREIVPVGIETEFGIAAMIDKMSSFNNY